MRVVFLDIDGPIISTGCYGIDNRAAMTRRVMNQNAIGYVNYFTKHAEAKVVINSSHATQDIEIMRFNPADFTSKPSERVRTIKDDLIAHGMARDAFHDEWKTLYASIGGLSRMDAIDMWLAKNTVDDWVCFDDIKFTDDPRLIVIHCDDGITMKDINKAAKQFGLMGPTMTWGC